MKIIHSLLAILIVFLISSCEDKGNSSATFKVWGNCEMCKKTIEGSLNKEAGIKKVEWDVKSKMVTIGYDSSAIKMNDLHKKIAATGYDTELEKGDDKAYNALHQCCQYKRKE